MVTNQLRRLHLFRAWCLNAYSDLRGQDMIEYALMAGVVALASAAATPNITSSLSTIFSKINSALVVQGGS